MTAVSRSAVWERCSCCRRASALRSSTRAPAAVTGAVVVLLSAAGSLGGLWDAVEEILEGYTNDDIIDCGVD
ncbi:hypothetical protein NMG29_40200 [Streptomyces cocklensis]|jgi:hypothetical protein|uniref:Uncharacterized protein n=1 Tax=Actinacidiphila cocklensis TaxID=887465 RepID=A0A9W4E0F6_9ACTN|nr:hypothetical protein [Actinacidiphila cocklensis]MDD1064280.1 hypothetical protein [Actinacidiphila cocklensis]CAG6399501.1 exported hypothetical protein [Actinacidiphila cocklensis]